MVLNFQSHNDQVWLTNLSHQDQEFSNYYLIQQSCFRFLLIIFNKDLYLRLIKNLFYYAYIKYNICFIK
jgi:hypothetical protein